MARERFLCSALGTDGRGQRRTFKVYKVGGQFRIYNDRGHNALSHSSYRITACNIKREIATVYDVRDVALEGSVDDAVRAAGWPDKYRQCENCGCAPTFRRYGNRGYCSPCNGMVKRIAELRSWDPTRPTVIQGCLLKPSVVDHYGEDEIEIIRQEYIRQGEERLSDLRMRNSMRKGEVPVDGVALRDEFARVLGAVRQKSQPSLHADYLAEVFGEEQRRVLFIVLDDIIEQILWRGFSHAPALDLVHRLRREAVSQNN
jgi:hypothetical protein